MTGWIPCSERMPPPLQFVLGYAPRCEIGIVWNEGGDIRGALCHAISGQYNVTMGIKVSHWMPLPEPPKDTP